MFEYLTPTQLVVVFWEAVEPWGAEKGHWRKALEDPHPILFFVLLLLLRGTESFLPPHFLCHDELRLLKTMNLNDLFLNLRCSKKTGIRRLRGKHHATNAGSPVILAK